ncbi:NAD(P)-dependent oxidoreductase [Microbacterium atlanticum]|uniref:NAD(P)-dependent oxidoreductase n=1 Tax=Microbacterium atlanticum TaxID=2782168 RepID=UPI001888FDF1|nr:NAD(P)-dependent oxidoreductase [Microbacterium atlanticum]
MTTIGFIGLGAMGRPMARHLAASGFTVTGFDPYAPVDRLDGFERAHTAAQAADADVVALMVATPTQAESALGGPDGVLAGLRPGAVVIVMATVGLESVQAIAAQVEAASGLVVDAPVSGGVRRAATGDLLIMASASPDAFARADATLDALGGNVYRLGAAVGDGQRMKLVNQLLCGVHIAVAAEGLAYAESLGVDPEQALAILSSGAAASFMLADRGPRMVAEEFDEPKSAIDIFVKDLGLVRAEARLPLPMVDAAFERFAAASAHGDGRLDDSAVITTYTRIDQEEHA